MSREINHELDVIVSCPKCGEKYIFEKFEMLDSIDMSEPCRNCGFLLFQYGSMKMRATMSLLMDDPKAKELLDKGDYKDFKNYLKKKLGLMY